MAWVYTKYNCNIHTNKVLNSKSHYILMFVCQQRKSNNAVMSQTRLNSLFWSPGFWHCNINLPSLARQTNIISGDLDALSRDSSPHIKFYFCPEMRRPRVHSRTNCLNSWSFKNVTLKMPYVDNTIRIITTTNCNLRSRILWSTAGK